MHRFLSLLVVLFVHILPASLYADEISTDLSEYRAWIIEMEGRERGPFARLRWCCNDGTVWPPQPYACKDHGGAADGQAAESLRIALDGSYVQVLATATAPWRRVPDPDGGLTFLPSSGSDTVLQPGDIEQVIDFVQHLPDKFPPITDDEGNSAPADVEFGFLDGDLRLFQLRPFLNSKQAKGIVYLHQMEARLKNTSLIEVDMNGIPGK